MAETSNTPRAASDASRPLFVGAAVAVSAIMIAGFAKNYYLRAWLGTRVITAMVHVHGLIMSAWILLFLTQTLLAATGRLDRHRKLGRVGAYLSVAIVVLGIYTIAGSIARQHLDSSAQSYALTFVSFDGLSLLLFAGLVAMALHLKSRPQTHKRLMLMAMLSLLPPAFGRLVAYFTHANVQAIVLALMCASVITCVAIDTLRNRRLHPACAWGGILIITTNLLTYFAQIAD